MREVLNNKFLMMAAVTNQLKKNSSSSLDYDPWEVIQDVARSVSEFVASSNIDRRVIATGAEPRINLWDIFSPNVDGWKDHMELAMGIYAEMVIDMLNPSEVLICEADAYFKVSALLADRGANITFINNEALYYYESFVRDASSHTPTYPYSTVDSSDILDQSFSGTYDMVIVPTYFIVNDDELLNAYIDRLNPGGVLYVAYANESGRLYTDDFYVEPIVEIFETILGRNDITTYHMPNGIGYQICIKK
jgi:hypothetical protein